MRKQILASLLVLAMVFSLLPVSALAAGGDVAQIGEDTYTSLSEAVEAAEAGHPATVRLIDNGVEEAPLIIPADKDITLDLQGHTLSMGENAMRVRGQLTIQDSTADREPEVGEDWVVADYEAGRIQYTGSGTAIIVEQGGQFTLESGIVDASQAGTGIYVNGNQNPESSSEKEEVNSSASLEGGYVHSMEYGLGVAGRGGQLAVSGGVIEAEGNTAIGGNGTNSAARYDGGTTIEITGGTMIGRMAENFVSQGYIACGIYHPQQGELIISGGRIYADQGVGIAMRGGTLEMSGGSVTATGSTSGKVGDSREALDCYAIQIDGDSGYYDYENCQVIISGSAQVSSEAEECVKVTPVGDGEKLVITGGTFSNNVSTYVPADYQCQQEGEGQYTVSAKAGMEAQVGEPAGNTATAQVSGSFSTSQEDNGTVDTEGTVLTIQAQASGAGAENVTKNVVTITPNALNSVAGQPSGAVSSIAVETNVGVLTLDKAAWDVITANATDERGTTAPVTLTIEAQKSDATVTAWVVTAQADGEDLFTSAENEGQAEITIAVAYTLPEESADVEVYCVDDGALEDMHADYDPESETVSWATTHLSTFRPLNVAEGDQATWITAAGDTGSGTLDSALTAVKTNGGTITLRTDARLDSAQYVLQGPVTIQGTGTITATVPNADGAQDALIGFDIRSGGSLTLSGSVTLAVQGTQRAEGDYDGTAFSATSGAALNVVNGATLKLEHLNRGIILPGGPPSTGTVTVEDAVLSANGIDGNFSNGGVFLFRNSQVSIDGCGSYGISANKVTVDHSTLKITNVQLSAIKTVDADGAIIVQNGGEVQVSDSGAGLPYTSDYGDASGVIDVGQPTKKPSQDPTPVNASLTVDEDSSITLTGEQDKLYLSNTAVLENEGKIDGEIVYEEAAGDTYRVTYLVQDQVYYTVAVEKAGDTVSYQAPADPQISGYRFDGWDYGDTDVTVADGSATFTPSGEGNSYTFTADLSRIPSGGGGATTYAVTVETAQHGTVKANVNRASSGSTVVVTVTPDAGYQLETLTVTGHDGETVELTRRNDGEYSFTMPASAVTVRASFVEEEHACSGEHFTDVDLNAWYHEALDYVVSNGLMQGISATEFAPGINLTRSQMVQVLYNLEGEPAAGDTSFDDVPADAWYAAATNWAASEGIVKGYGDGNFGPNDPITREQMMLILYHYAQYKGYDTEQNGGSLQDFQDAADISDWALEGVEWAVKAGLINGKGDGTLDPNGTATRVEVAQIFMNFCEQMAQ